MSSISQQELRAWRLFFETALSLIDALGDDFEREEGFPVQWYDVLVHLEDAPEGLRMNELAEKILYSKSGLTRVIDRMERAGLVQRSRPENDRRSIFVLLTPKGRQETIRLRARHHEWIAENFTQHLTTTDVTSLTRAFEKLGVQARTRRPGRVTG